MPAMPDHSQPTAISAIVLAGGRGSRMRNQDKGLLRVNGVRLIDLLLDRLAPQVDDITISANRNLAQYQTTGYNCVRDLNNDYQGPLAGIVAAAVHARNELILLCPCDAPAIPTDLASRLQYALDQSGADLAVPHDGTHAQVLHALIRRPVVDQISLQLNAGQRAVHEVLASFDVCSVDYSNQPERFANINSDTDLARFNR